MRILFLPMTGDQNPPKSERKLSEQLDVDFALEAAQLGVWEFNPITFGVVWDERCRALFGVTKGNYISYEQATAHMHPDDKDRINQAILWSMNPLSGGIYDQTYRTIGVEDGQLRWVRFTGKVSFTPTGEVARYAGVAQEVTQQVLAQQQLVESEARLQTIVSTSPTAIALLRGPDFVIETANQAYIDLLGKGPDILGKPFKVVLPELEHQAIFPILEQVYRDQQYFNASARAIDLIRAGVTVNEYYNFSYTPLLDAHHQTYAILNTAIVVTDQVRIQQVLLEKEAALAASNQELAVSNANYALINDELTLTNQHVAAANQALEQANQALLHSNQNLEQFAYIASHDLQEPLRKIQQFGDLLKVRLSGLVGGEDLTYLERMQVAAGRMSVLIKDLLTFSRIATTQAAAQPVGLHEVVIEVLDSLSVAIEESGAQLELDDLPTVQGDRLQLSQLFQNLLANALKFRRTSPDGTLLTPRIAVRARLLARSELPASAQPTRDTGQYQLIEVIDNGIGFEEKYADRIFQVFQRLHGKNEFSGTGVGLAIVQKVVTNHGGAITATSQLGQGATFSVYLPG